MLVFGEGIAIGQPNIPTNVKGLRIIGKFDSCQIYSVVRET